jgi:hypothetical protein
VGYLGSVDSKEDEESRMTGVPNAEIAETKERKRSEGGMVVSVGWSDPLASRREPKWEERGYTPAVFVRVARKGLRLYGTWKNLRKTGGRLQSEIIVSRGRGLKSPKRRSG